MGELVILAKKALAKKLQGLRDSEIKLLVGVEAGIKVDYRIYEEKDRIIRAEVINWLCTDKKAQELITHLGVLRSGRS